MLDTVPYQTRVHLFSAASSLGCANFGLKQIGTDNEAKYGTDVADFLHNNFYVDDGLKCVPSAGTAVNMIKKCQTMCKD